VYKVRPGGSGLRRAPGLLLLTPVCPLRPASLARCRQVLAAQATARPTITRGGHRPRAA